MSIKPLRGLSLIASDFYEGVDLISFNLAEMFLVHWQIRLAVKEPCMLKISSLPASVN
jgi:hypothetical protein